MTYRTDSGASTTPGESRRSGTISPLPSNGHARMDDGHVVWVDRRRPDTTPIVLLDSPTGQRQVIAPEGSSPEIDGDHVVYLVPGSPNSSGLARGDVFLHTISTGETRRLTSDAETRSNYRLSVQGDLVTWLSVASVGIEDPMAGDTSLHLYDIAKNQTVTPAAVKPGAGGLGDHVANAQRVVWQKMPSYVPGGPSVEVRTPPSCCVLS